MKDLTGFEAPSADFLDSKPLLQSQVALQESTLAPYEKSIEVLATTAKLKSFEQKKKCYMYARRKSQKEIWEFWEKREYPEERLVLSEDMRLGIVAFQIIKSQAVNIFTDIKVLRYFMNMANEEESKALTTLENAILAILQDYEMVWDSEKSSSSPEAGRHNNDNASMASKRSVAVHQMGNNRQNQNIVRYAKYSSDEEVDPLYLSTPKQQKQGRKSCSFFYQELNSQT